MVEVHEDPQGLPADFDWRHYVRMYPDLSRTGIRSSSMATGHFSNSGFSEGRLQHLPPLYIEYTACVNVWGACENYVYHAHFCNTLIIPSADQLYSHIAALALALELHAQVVLPPALAKNRQGRWVPYPLETLLAAGDMIEAAQKEQLVLWRVGIFAHCLRTVCALSAHSCTLHTTQRQAPRSSLKKSQSGLPPFNDADFAPDTAYPWFRLETRIPDHDVLTFGNFYHARRSMGDIVDEIVQRIGSKAVTEFQADKRDQRVHRVLLVRLPCTAFAIEDPTCVRCFSFLLRCCPS